MKRLEPGGLTESPGGGGRGAGRHRSSFRAGPRAGGGAIWASTPGEAVSTFGRGRSWARVGEAVFATLLGPDGHVRSTASGSRRPGNPRWLRGHASYHHLVEQRRLIAVYVALIATWCVTDGAAASEGRCTGAGAMNPCSRSKWLAGQSQDPWAGGRPGWPAVTHHRRVRACDQGTRGEPGLKGAGAWPRRAWPEGGGQARDRKEAENVYSPGAARTGHPGNPDVALLHVQEGGRRSGGWSTTRKRGAFGPGRGERSRAARVLAEVAPPRGPACSARTDAGGGNANAPLAGSPAGPAPCWWSSYESGRARGHPWTHYRRRAFYPPGCPATTGPAGRCVTRIPRRRRPLTNRGQATAAGGRRDREVRCGSPRGDGHGWDRGTNSRTVNRFKGPRTGPWAWSGTGGNPGPNRVGRTSCEGRPRAAAAAWFAPGSRLQTGNAKHR